MNELIDKFLFELFDGLRDKTTVLFGEFIADAQALADKRYEYGENTIVHLFIYYFTIYYLLFVCPVIN